MQHRVEYDHYYAAIEAETAAFAAVTADADLSVPVPTCPGWNVGLLVGHLRQSHDWFASLVTSRAQTFIPPAVPADLDLSGLDWSGQVAALARRSLDDVADGEDGKVRADWLAQGAANLTGAVREFGPDNPVWTTYGEPHAGFWVVIGLLETAVHRADAELAVTGGLRTDLTPQLAAGCVDFWMTALAEPSARPFFGPMVGGLAGNGETLRFEASDLDQDAHWFMTRTPDGPRLERRDEGGDVVVRATAADLLLLLKGRLPATDGRVVVQGEEKLLDHWLAHAYA
jgi:uncharacterized protein (TIGR03083 family)